MEQAAPLRPASAEGAFYELLHGAKSDLLFLDHLEILFDQLLMLNATELVRNASRRFVLVACWPGSVDSSTLKFGPPDHPAHFHISIPEMECPVHALTVS